MWMFKLLPYDSDHSYNQTLFIASKLKHEMQILGPS